MAIVSAQAEVKLSNGSLKNISKAYGFYLGQRKSLGYIKTVYPSLRKKAAITELRFDSTFGSAVREMDKVMTSKLAGKWEQLKKQMLPSTYEADYLQGVTFLEAEAFLEQVNQRSKGEIPEDILRVFLIFTPRYNKMPELEFAEGWKYKFVSNGSGKAKNVPFTINIPKSWLAKEADRPNIVQKFVSEGGYGFEQIMVMVKDTGLKPNDYITRNEIQSMVANDELVTMLPANSRLINGGELNLSGYPGYWVHFTNTTQVGRQTAEAEMIVYGIFPEDKYVSIQGYVPTSTNGVALNTKGFEHFEKLFDLVASSFILPNKYN